ncbi:MAG: hypothetical protein J6Q54_00935 [Oscillospiraceae bacterium]|nr:hypothetical protein [Oscillospiraceae bacterium]
MKMRNIWMLMLALVMVFTLCACNSGETGATQAPTQAPTEATTEPAETTEPTLPEGKAVYTVKVVDEGGNPVVGAMVQLCLEACIPSITDAEGVATYTVDEANYKVSFVAMPEGYTSDVTEFYFDAGSYELTITLKAVA